MGIFMAYTINYAAACDKGRLRGGNQDNFWCDGHYLPEINDGLPEIIAGTAALTFPRVFALFDGMGGEAHGEAASYLAAKTFDSECTGGKTLSAQDFYKLFFTANDSVCAYQKQTGVLNVGTTAAAVAFFSDAVFVADIGDSKVYLFSGGALRQISVEHVMQGKFRGKPPLSQHLGIPTDEFVIEPHLKKESYRAGDRYLICSDGLTDMLTDGEIESIMKRGDDIKTCASVLLNGALENGGKDNVTVIVCEIAE